MWLCAKNRTREGYFVHKECIAEEMLLLAAVAASKQTSLFLRISFAGTAITVAALHSQELMYTVNCQMVVLSTVIGRDCVEWYNTVKGPALVVLVFLSVIVNCKQDIKKAMICIKKISVLLWVCRYEGIFLNLLFMLFKPLSTFPLKFNYSFLCR